MKLHARSLLVLWILLAFLASCSPKPEGPQPPEIRYGQEMCSACGMVIDEPRFAAATLLVSEKYLKFDDAREMIIYHMNHQEDQVAAWFVHDYSSEKWIRGEAAIFVYSKSLQTPMGGGIVAFANQAEAEAYAAEHNGTIYNLDKIRAQVHMVEHP
jgi:copper chaperone NosL